jgi:FPC/CPF motif-containing protein YcgG
MDQLRKNHETIAGFEGFIHDPLFPCLGAKSALAQDHITYCLADDIQTADCDAEITENLQAFALNCTPESVFVSFAVIFQNSPLMSEGEFEHYLWERLQAIHNIDAAHYAWDSQVSTNPDSVDFSLSVGGKAFYVVGLHPNASRQARKFTTPALVFNLHNQFELLRDKGNYERMRQAITTRDIKLCGTKNPMLAQHGKSSEARQYSGRMVDERWKCHFHAQQKSQA